MQGSRGALDLRRPLTVFIAVSVATLVIDQLTKALVRANFEPGESLVVIEGVFRLTYVRNIGAAFGLLPGYQPIFIAVSLVVFVVVWAYWRRYHPTAWPTVIALALIVGGSVGNLVDRAFLGRVTDFFDAAFIDFPVFNVADSAIVFGVGMLIVWLFVAPEPETHTAAPACAQSPVDEA